MVHLPDIDGCVVEDLAVAVPAAERGPAAAGRVVAADVAEDLAALGVFQQVQLQVWVTLAAMRCEAETPNAVNFHKVQVKLIKVRSKKIIHRITKHYELRFRDIRILLWQAHNLSFALCVPHLVVFAGVSEKMSEEVEAGTFSDQDEVGGAVGQVSGGRKTFRAAWTRAAHTCRVYGQKLPPDPPPLAIAPCNNTMVSITFFFC